MSKIWTKRQGICLVDVGTVSDVDVRLSQTKFPYLPGRFLGKFPNPAVCEEKKEGAQLMVNRPSLVRPNFRIR
jgi:hypothetical protein